MKHHFDMVQKSMRRQGLFKFLVVSCLVERCQGYGLLLTWLGGGGRGEGEEE